jgi:peptidoglycan/xylan/chitin deacetylase (PgdA/CDA1 family)
MTAVQSEVVLTFDNLGEAAALQRGTWDPAVGLGRDPSVTEALPRLLDLLDEQRLTATFFVEAINCEINPGAVLEIARRGHEVGVHGWRHEPWGELDAATAGALLIQCRRAFDRLGLTPTAFRPPGGGMPQAAETLVDDFRWISPEEGVQVRGVARIPFSWELVDAYHLMQRFTAMRGGDPPAPPGQVTELFLDALRRSGRQTLVLHPFLMLDPAWWDGVRAILEQLAARRDGGQVWTGPGGALAR